MLSHMNWRKIICEIIQVTYEIWHFICEFLFHIWNSSFHIRNPWFHIWNSNFICEKTWNFRKGWALTRKCRCFVTIVASTRTQSPNQQSYRPRKSTTDNLLHSGEAETTKLAYVLEEIRYRATVHQKEELDIYQTLEWMKAGARPKLEEIVYTNPTIGNLWIQFDRLRLEDGLLCRD